MEIDNNTQLCFEMSEEDEEGNCTAIYVFTKKSIEVTDFLKASVAIVKILLEDYDAEVIERIENDEFIITKLKLKERNK